MSDEKGALKELFCETAKERDIYIEMKENTADPERAAYYDGMATAYDTVRGMIFLKAGEEDWIK